MTDDTQGTVQVKRFDYDPYDEDCGTPLMEENPVGEWVRYSDYAALQDTVKRLERERERWEKHATTGDGVLARTRAKLEAAERRLAEQEKEQGEAVAWLKARTLDALNEGHAGAYTAQIANLPMHDHGFTVPLYATPPSPEPDAELVAARDVLTERRRQIEAEGWTPEHDDTHDNGELAAAASCYAYPNASARKMVPSRWNRGRGMDDDDFPVGSTNVPANWPDWDGDWWKPTGRRRNLVKAGALIIAEIERLDRACHRKQGGE